MRKSPPGLFPGCFWLAALRENLCAGSWESFREAERETKVEDLKKTRHQVIEGWLKLPIRLGRAEPVGPVSSRVMMGHCQGCESQPWRGLKVLVRLEGMA